MKHKTRTVLSAVILAGMASFAVAQTTVRVAAWNVETIGDPGSTQYIAALAVLDRICADVVAINEVLNANDIPNFQQLATDAGYDFTVVPNTNPFGDMRNAFMSKFPILAETIHTSSALSGDGSANDITRLMIEVVIDVPGDAADLTLVTEHWKASGGNDDEFRRACESIRMSQTIADLDSLTDAYVILGDVNEELEDVPGSPNPFFELPSGLPVSFSLGADLQALLDGEGILNNPFFYLEDETGPNMATLDALQLDGTEITRPSSGRRLDYIFVSQALLELGPLTEVYDSDDEGLPGGLDKCGNALGSSTSLDAADHLLVFVDLIMPAGAGPLCEGDANGDGAVDPLDSGFVLARFGCLVGSGDPNCDAADQNGDGAVDPLDSGFVLARFGTCEPPPPPSGACCMGEACSEETEEDCGSAGGAYQGDDTDCASSECQAPPDNITINELRINQPDTDDDEYFELFGPPNESLAGLTYLVIGDGAGGSGVIEAVVDLTGSSIPSSGFFLATEGTFTLNGATPDLIVNLNFENSDNVTHMLVSNFSGANGDDLDTNDDGVLDSTPWSQIIDCLGLVETIGSGDELYCTTTLGPDTIFVPGHGYRCEDGSGVWQIGPFEFVGEDTPGQPNACP